MNGSSECPTLALVLQGLLDQSLGDLDGRTPLECASTPQLDLLFSQANSHRLCALSPLSTEAGLLHFLGADPEPADVRRGPLEALSLGLDIPQGAVAFSTRLASIGQTTLVDVSDELVHEGEAQALYQALNQDLGGSDLQFHHLRGARGVAILKDVSLDNLDPEPWNPVEQCGKNWVELIPSAAPEGRLLALNQAIHDILNQHEINVLREDLEERPVNHLLLFDGGPPPTWLPLCGSISEGWELSSPFAATCGVARGLGLEVWDVPREQVRFDYVKQVLERLEHNGVGQPGTIVEFPYLWESTYKGDLLEKIKTIEWLDRHLIGPVHHLCRDRRWRLLVLPMTSTDIRIGRANLGDWLALEWDSNLDEPIRDELLSESILASINGRTPLHSLNHGLRHAARAGDSHGWHDTSTHDPTTEIGGELVF